MSAGKKMMERSASGGRSALVARKCFAAGVSCQQFVVLVIALIVPSGDCLSLWKNMTIGLVETRLRFPIKAM